MLPALQPLSLKNFLQAPVTREYGCCHQFYHRGEKQHLPNFDVGGIRVDFERRLDFGKGREACVSVQGVRCFFI